MQAAARAGQLKGLVKSKKMGSAQQQLLLLCFLFFLLSAVAPQVRASSFFFSFLGSFRVESISICNMLVLHNTSNAITKR